MNKVQIAQLNSCLNTQLTLDNAVMIWQNHAAFAANVAEFKQVIAEIEKYRNLQISDNGANRIEKQKIRKAMTAKAMIIRNAVMNYASDVDDIMLYKTINICDSKLLYNNQSKSETKAMIIESIARENADKLAPYAITITDIDEYAKLVEKYRKSIPTVRTNIISIKTATEKVGELTKKARKIVNTKLKLGITQFLNNAPDFYNEMKHSFAINDLPTRFTKMDATIIDKESGENLSEVKVTATNSKESLTEYSNPIGEMEFRTFWPTYYNLTFECPGYVTVEMKAVKAERGKKMDFGVIEMVRL